MATIKDVHDTLKSIQQDWKDINGAHRVLIEKSTAAITESNVLARKIETELKKVKTPPYKTLVFWIKLIPAIIIALAVLVLVKGAVNGDKCFKYDKLAYNCEMENL